MTTWICFAVGMGGFLISVYGLAGWLCRVPVAEDAVPAYIGGLSVLLAALVLGLAFS